MSVPASAQLTYGTLDNFDVINDTGGETHGFEIELEGISSADVAYTFGAPYQRYGDPTLVPTATGVIIRYSAAYDPVGHVWSATTPSTAPPYLPTQGHSCWTGGVSDPAIYYASGCDHFGASLNAVPTKTTYHWLVEGTPGVLVRFGTKVPLPTPVWNVTPPPSPAQQPIAAAVIVPPPPDQFEFGDALWAKVFVTELPEPVQAADLDHMVIDDPAVDIVPNEPAEVEFEWVLVQASVNNAGEQEFGGAAEVGAGNEAVSRRFEFYAYAGMYDPENHEALCDNPIAPDQQIPERCGTPDADGVAGVGILIGTQNAAINLGGEFAAGGNHSPIATPDSTSMAEDGELTLSSADLLGNDSDQDGDPLTLESVQAAVNGTVWLSAGSAVFSPNANYNGPASFTYTINDGKGATSTATVGITVTSVNDPPSAGADTASTNEDMPVTISAATLLANDTDIDGNPLSIVSVQDATGGTVGLLGGNVTFTPDLNYNGAAGFTYTVHDGNGGSANGAVTVNVAPVNDPPVANAGSDQTAAVRTTVTFDGSSSSDVDSNTLSYGWSVVGPPHTKVRLTGANTANATFVPRKPGIYVATLVVSDGVLTATDTVTVIVTK